MSTRARIVIVDPSTGAKNFLYRSCDGYPSNLGEALVTACDLNRGAPDLDSFTYKLLKGDAGLEGDTYGENACLDWVYTIEWTVDATAIFAQEVDWQGDNKRPVRERLKERIDVRAYVEELHEQRHRRDLYVASLKEKIEPCPLCGSAPDIYVSEGMTLFAMRCPRFTCGNHHDIEARSEKDLIEAWHNSARKGQLGRRAI